MKPRKLAWTWLGTHQHTGMSWETPLAGLTRLGACKLALTQVEARTRLEAWGLAWIGLEMHKLAWTQLETCKLVWKQQEACKLACSWVETCTLARKQLESCELAC